MTSKEQRAEARRRNASFVATNANHAIIASRGSVLERMPADDKERGEAILRLFELCSWLDPRFDLPMDKSKVRALRADK